MFKTFTLVGFMLYVCMGWLVASLLPQDPSVWQAMSAILVVVLLVIIDVRSFRQGLEVGGETVRDVMRQLLDEKKLKVVPCESEVPRAGN